MIPSLLVLYTGALITDIKTRNLLTILITGHQWYWTYELKYYLAGIQNEIIFDSYLLDINFSESRFLETDTQLFLAKGKRVRLLITSEDVIHSWAIPSFGVKVDAVPGRLNKIIIKPIIRGRFFGQCSELCGYGHAIMPISIVVL